MASYENRSFQRDEKSPGSVASRSDSDDSRRNLYTQDAIHLWNRETNNVKHNTNLLICNSKFHGTKQNVKHWYWSYAVPCYYIHIPPIVIRLWGYSSSWMPTCMPNTTSGQYPHTLLRFVFGSEHYHYAVAYQQMRTWFPGSPPYTYVWWISLTLLTPRDIVWDTSSSSFLFVISSERAHKVLLNISHYSIINLVIIYMGQYIGISSWYYSVSNVSSLAYQLYYTILK